MLLVCGCSADAGVFDGDALDNLTGPGSTASAVCVDGAFQCEVFDQVNNERAKAGLPAMKYNAYLASAAAAHASDMSLQGYFSHESTDGRSFSDRVAETPYGGFATGENIAKGQREATSVMNGWMNSDGHRRNILSDRSNEIGVGFVDNHWVQVFGRASNQ